MIYARKCGGRRGEEKEKGEERAREE